MGKSYKFKIGDWVKFKKYYKVYSNGGERYASEIGLSKSITGQICGAVIRHLGKIKTDEFDYHNQYPFLVPEKSLILYQIRNGMINVPYEVKEENIEKTEIIKEIPWKHVYISDSFREDAREQANDMPRNEKGKFLKEPMRKKNVSYFNR